MKQSIFVTNNDTKQLEIYDEEGSMIFASKIKSRSIMNRLDFVIEFLNNWVEYDPKYKKFYIDFIKEYYEISNENEKKKNDTTCKQQSLIILEKVDELKGLINEYLEKVDFTKSVGYKEMTPKRKGSSKGQIIFSFEEACELARSSCFIKALVPFMCSSCAVDYELQKKLFMSAAENLSELDLLVKIYRLIKSKVFGTTTSSGHLWVYLGYIKGVTPDSISLNILRSILETVLTTQKYGSDPVTYMASFIKSSVEYIFTDVYTDTILYVTNFFVERSKGDDFFDKIVAKSSVEYAIITPTIEVYTQTVQKVLDTVTHASPAVSYIALPFISRILNIKYSHFSNLGLQYQYIMGLFVSEIFERENEFPTLTKILRSFTRDVIPKDRTFSAFKQCPAESVALLNSAPELLKHLVRNEDDQKIHIDRLLGTILSANYLDFLSGTTLTVNKKQAAKEILVFYKRLFDGEFDKYKILNLSQVTIQKKGVDLDSILLT